MKIVGFGDSFIAHNPNPLGYLNIVGKHFGADVHWNGHPGTSSWDTFFQFRNYTDPIDVAIFCWSDFSRLYHPNIRGICPASSFQYHDPDEWDGPTWAAAKQYYEYLYDWTKSEYEAMAFYQWFDNYTERFGKIKFIHLWSFAKNKAINGDPWAQYKQDANVLEYHHRFKHGVEIRPALMHYSHAEDWQPGADTRGNHMAPRFHKYLSDFIIDGIENYEPGKLYAPK